MSIEAPRTAPPTYVDANRLWVDSRLRYEIGRRVEGPALARLGARGERCVEIGTGRRGLGARCAVELFGSTTVLAYDLHAASVERAASRTADLAAVQVREGDATALPLPDADCDLLVSFHALHHIDDWRAAIAEIARVLRPGGRLAYVEMTSRFVDAPWLRAVSRHPADRFSAEQLGSELARHGLVVGDRRSERLGGRWVLGVAVKD